MAMHKARQAEQDGFRPHLSIIDATSAMSEGRGLLASPLVAEARKRGLVPGMRYKGIREWLIWGEIPQPAILHDLPFHHLRSLTAADIGVADLLALDDIDPAPQMSLPRIRKSLLRQEVVLDASAGHAIGRLTSLFGLATTSPPPAIRQFVYDLFQGWALGAFEVEAMAEAFLAGLVDAEARDGAALVVLSDGEEGELRRAFTRGVERAVDDLATERRAVRR